MHWDHELRIGAFPGAEVGRLESRPSEQWFIESFVLLRNRAWKAGCKPAARFMGAQKKRPGKIPGLAQTIKRGVYLRARKNFVPVGAPTAYGLVAPVTSVYGPLTISACCRAPV